MWDIPDYNYHISVHAVDIDTALLVLSDLYLKGLRCCRIKESLDKLTSGETLYQPFLHYLPNQGYYSLYLAIHFDEIDPEVLLSLPDYEIYGIEIKHLSFYTEDFDFSRSGILPYLTHVKYLRVENVVVSEPQVLFRHMPELQILLLSNTDFKRLIPSSFPPSKLEALILNIQPLQSIDPHSFSHLHQLKYLVIGLMMATEIPVELFHPLPNLSYLDLHATDISNLTAEHFTYNVGLEAIKLPETLNYFSYVSLPQLVRIHCFPTTILHEKYHALERLEILSIRTIS